MSVPTINNGTYTSTIRNEYTVYEFTSNASIKFSQDSNIDLLVVGGGGGGFANYYKETTLTKEYLNGYGGAGGAYEHMNLPVKSGTNYIITVGTGGAVYISPVDNSISRGYGSKSSFIDESQTVNITVGGGAGGITEDIQEYSCGGCGSYIEKEIIKKSTNASVINDVSINNLYDLFLSKSTSTAIDTEDTDISINCNNATSDRGGGAGGTDGSGFVSKITGETYSTGAGYYTIAKYGSGTYPDIYDGIYPANSYITISPNANSNQNATTKGNDGIVLFRISPSVNTTPPINNPIVTKAPIARIDVVPENLIAYYPFDTELMQGVNDTYNKINIANIASGRPIYEGSMENGVISLSDYRVGNSSVELNYNTILNITIPSYTDTPATLGPLVTTPPAVNTKVFSLSFFFNIRGINNQNLPSYIFKISTESGKKLNPNISLDTSGNLKYTININTYSYDITGFAGYLDGQWHHLVLSLTGKIIIFIDTELIELKNNKDYKYENYSTKILTVGQNINGNIDDLRIYNKILKYKDVLKLYNSTTSYTIEYPSTQRPNSLQNANSLQKVIEGSNNVSIDNPFSKQSFTTMYGHDVQSTTMKIMNISIGILFSIGYLYYTIKQMNK